MLQQETIICAMCSYYW